MFLQEEEIKKFYQSMPEKISEARKQLNKPLTYAEKVIFAHMLSFDEELKRGSTTIRIFPDRVAMQDATAQMALLQFMLTGKKIVEVPTTIHCDHLILAQQGAAADLQKALLENNEVHQFMKTASSRYGIGFWNPGAGIIHQVVLEKYAFPGGMIIGTDSHTPNAGGLGMIAIGVGGAEAVDVMAGEGFTLTLPKLIGVKLTGTLNGWTAPKDVILKLAGILTVKGGTGYIIEYFGSGTSAISATGKATITNMGAELGATTSLFPYDERIYSYLYATDRAVVADAAEKVKEYLQSDPEVHEHPEKYYDQLIEIDLSCLEPYIVGPHTPDLAREISKLAKDVEQNHWPASLTYALLGSCTNSSYEDMSRAVQIVRQASAGGLKTQCGFLVTPGSEQIYKTMQRDGMVEIFEATGAVVLANACGPCIGQWQRTDAAKDTDNSILTSYNRNFKKRNDGNAGTHAFIASPEIVTAIAFAGTLKFNPLQDTISLPDGTAFMFTAPERGEEIPAKGFVSDATGYEAPSGEGTVEVDPKSDRLQLLNAFSKWDTAKDFKDLAVLIKAAGKCTTDHISPAGRWLKYRGHLNNISDNMFSGIVNVFRQQTLQQTGTGKNQLTGEIQTFAAVARYYKQNGFGWVAVGDENYGEGSSREHAAMEPRFLGCRAVLAKSFARIAETNLKRQGILPLWFTNSNDYDKILEDDRISFHSLQVREFAPITVFIKHKDGSVDTIQVTHTLNQEHVHWFYAGSAINYFREKEKKKVEVK